MNRKRSLHAVSIELDPVPGWGNSPSDHTSLIRRELDASVPHYNPIVQKLTHVYVVQTTQTELHTVWVDQSEAEAQAEALNDHYGKGFAWVQNEIIAGDFNRSYL
jgi:hypothetical protein